MVNAEKLKSENSRWYGNLYTSILQHCSVVLTMSVSNVQCPWTPWHFKTTRDQPKMWPTANQKKCLLWLSYFCTDFMTLRSLWWYLYSTYLENIARIANAVHCHPWLSGKKVMKSGSKFEFFLKIVKIVKKNCQNFQNSYWVICFLKFIQGDFLKFIQCDLKKK